MEHGSLITFKPDGTPVRVADVDLAATVQKMLGIIKIEFLPYRPDELPDFYYFCNGDRYPTDSPQGEVLLSTSANFKLDWGITVIDNTISIPNMFYTDGRGYFLRAVNGSSRLVGSRQDDTMRTINGTASVPRAGMSGATGALKTSGAGGRYTTGETSGSSVLTLNTALLGANFSGTETTPLNIGMTPAIFLGV